MDDSGNSSFAKLGQGGAPDYLAIIAALRSGGAARIDAVRLHYLEVLAKRALAHHGSVRRLLDQKLATALVQFRERMDGAHADAAAAAPKGEAPVAPLDELIRRLQQAAPESLEARRDSHGEARPELKTWRDFRSTWSKLSTDKQVAQAFKQAPPNAGPINSHMLVLRSLALMRELSPDYLNRFVSYADTLLCLDECDKKKPLVAKKISSARVTKK